MKLIRNFFIWLYSNIDLWLAIQRAEKAYRGEFIIGVNKDKSKRYLVGNTRYYVLPDADDKLIIMNRRQMHKLRTMKMMSNEAKVRHLKEESFYYTADGSGNTISKALKEFKRQKYFEYRVEVYNKRRAARKFIKQSLRKSKKLRREA
jgi:hypothetical protein